MADASITQAAQSGARPRHPLAPWGWLAITLPMVFGGVDAASAQTQPAPASEREATPSMTVTATLPDQVQWPKTVSAFGTVAAWQEASISAQIGGYQLVEVAVNVGDHVHKGDVLARLDASLLRAEEEQLLASYEQSQANQKRALRLKASSAISERDALDYITQAKTDSAALALKRLQIGYTEVRAPDDGTISARYATLGAVVPVGEELFRMIRQDRLEWRGELTAEQLLKVQPGQTVSLDLPDASVAIATVRQLAPALVSDTRLATVYADIQPGSHARAGMYASGAVHLGDTAALIVPAESAIIRDGRSFVPVLTGDDPTATVTLRPVVIGRRLGASMEVTDGLAPDERVAVEGAGFLNDRDVVRVVPATGDQGANRQ